MDNNKAKKKIADLRAMVKRFRSGMQTWECQDAQADMNKALDDLEREILGTVEEPKTVRGSVR